MYKAVLIPVLGFPLLHTAWGVAQYASASCFVVHGFSASEFNVSSSPIRDGRHQTLGHPEGNILMPMRTEAQYV